MVILNTTRGRNSAVAGCRTKTRPKLLKSITSLEDTVVSIFQAWSITQLLNTFRPLAVFSNILWSSIFTAFGQGGALFLDRPIVRERVCLFSVLCVLFVVFTVII